MKITARIDKTKSFSEMCGEPGVKYLQNGCFYDADGLFVRDSGLTPPPPAKKPSAKLLEEKKQLDNHAAAIARAAAMLGPFGRDNRQTKLLEDAERENMRALVAEQRYA